MEALGGGLAEVQAALSPFVHLPQGALGPEEGLQGLHEAFLGEVVGVGVDHLGAEEKPHPRPVVQAGEGLLQGPLADLHPALLGALGVDLGEVGPALQGPREHRLHEL